MAMSNCGRLAPPSPTPPTTALPRWTKARLSTTSGWAGHWPLRPRCRRCATTDVSRPPSRTLHGEPPRPAKVPLNIKRKRLVNRLDLEQAMRHHPLLASNDDSAECPPIPPTPEMTPCDPSLPFGPEQSQWRLPRCNGHLCGNVGQQVLDLCGRSRRGARISPISALGLCLNRCCRPRAAIRCLATEARITASAMTARREASGWGGWRVSGAKRLRSRNRNRGLSHAASRPSGGKRVRSRAGLAMLRMC